jgi:ElaB/YqjD/DUF883 family membrane-anchored ribosome-binding protein
MANALDESTVKSNPEVEAECAACLGNEVKETVQRVEKGVNNAKAAVSGKIEDGKIAAERLLKRGRYVVEDSVDQTLHKIKRNPVRSLALAFTAGAVLGFLVPRLSKK